MVYIDEALYLVESTKKSVVDVKIRDVLWESRNYYTLALIYLQLYDEETDSISIYRTLRVYFFLIKYFNLLFLV